MTTTPHLRSVDDDTPPAPTVLKSNTFEGHVVTQHRAKLTSVAGLEIDKLLEIDEMVRIVIEGTVTGVGHLVDNVTGELVRVHTIKVSDAAQVPDAMIIPGLDGQY
jgi:hypothetical protein